MRLYHPVSMVLQCNRTKRRLNVALNHVPIVHCYNPLWVRVYCKTIKSWSTVVQCYLCPQISQSQLLRVKTLIIPSYFDITPFYFLSGAPPSNYFPPFINHWCRIQLIVSAWWYQERSPARCRIRENVPRIVFEYILWK